MANRQITSSPFPDLPEGTVTFLFTDIEGSTRLLQRLGEGYAALLVDHHRILRRVWAQWNGQEVSTDGDAFFVAFPKATQAVAAAAEAQRALAEHPWPEGVSVGVRMGAHTGEPWVLDEDYAGLDVHRAARIAHVGHGGQVLLSETTAALVQDDLPDGVTLLDLGRHLLKDMHRPEHIRQLAIAGLANQFPPLTSQGVLPEEAERSPREVGECPYQGLAAFREDDAPFYFGRESFIDTLAEAVRRQPMVAVIVGSSGSGKSSALFAGLLPRLRKEPGWTVATLRPGAQPFYALAGALLPLLEGKLSETDRLLETQKLAEGLSQGDISLVQIIERVLDKDRATRQLLLVLDQFEELYTLGPDESLQQHFVDQLLEVVAAGQGRRAAPGVVLMTMRADFMGQALAYRPLADALQEASLLMGPMNREELRAAIEKPAEKQGAAFEAGLVERVLDDVGDRPGNLPLLEFTLTQLWEAQSDGWLSHDDYEALGGVEGALASYADQVYEELPREEQERARRALVQLVRPGEGTEDTRRVATREELGDEGWALLRHLANQRLVITGRDVEGRETAEVIHEALIQRWSRFRDWMEGDRAFRAWQERLRANLRQWRETDEDEGALLSGVPLSVAEEWLAERGEELSPAEEAYIQAGTAREERREQARIEQQHRERLLQAEQRAARRLRRLAIALAIFIFIAVGAAMVALNSSAEAERQRSSAEENEGRAVVEAAAAATAQVEAQEAEAVALTERDSAATAEADAIREAERAQQAEEEANEAKDAAQAAQAETEHQKRIVLAQSLATLGPSILEGSNDTELAILLALEAANINYEIGGALDWIAYQGLKQALGGSVFNEAIQSGQGAIRAAAFSPDGRILALASTTNIGTSEFPIFDGVVRLLDLTDPGLEPVNLEGHSNLVMAVAFSPDSRLLASGSADRTVRVWDLAAPEEPLAILEEHTAGVNALAFSPDGRFLASGSDDRSIRLWNPADLSAPPHILEGQDSALKSLAFSPDGQTLVSGGAGGAILFWDLANIGSSFTAVPGHQGSVLSLVFSPDGTALASGGADGAIRLWNPAKPDAPTAVIPGNDLVYALAFSPDGATLASAGGNQLLRLWALSDTGAPSAVLGGHTDTIYTLAFAPDGLALVSGSGDETARLWHLEGDPGQPVILQGHERAIYALAFAPDGQTIASASLDGTTRLWDLSSVETEPVIIQNSDTSDLAVSFSPDGRWLASGGSSTMIWELSDLSAPIFVLEENHSALFAPDRLSLATARLVGERTSAIHLWNLAVPDPSFTVVGETGRGVVGLVFSPDGQSLVSATENNPISLWNLSGTGSISQLLSNVERSTSLAISPDGRTLATSGNFGVHLRDLPDLRAPETLFPGDNPVSMVAFSADGRTLATAGADRLIRLWNLDHRQSPPIVLRGHEEAVQALTYSADGLLLASGGDDATVRLWLTLDGLREIGCQQVRRNLTQEEWALYLGEDEPYRETCPEIERRPTADG